MNEGSSVSIKFHPCILVFFWLHWFSPLQGHVHPYLLPSCSIKGQLFPWTVPSVIYFVWRKVKRETQIYSQPQAVASILTHWAEVSKKNCQREAGIPVTNIFEKPGWMGLGVGRFLDFKHKMYQRLCSAKKDSQLPSRMRGTRLRLSVSLPPWPIYTCAMDPWTSGCVRRKRDRAGASLFHSCLNYCRSRVPKKPTAEINILAVTGGPPRSHFLIN